MKKTLLILAVLGLGLQAGPALARSADLFNDAVWASANRPTTRSDSQRTSDMFPSVPVLSSRADMFPKIKAPFGQRQDVLKLRPVSAPISGLFRPWANR